jgi:hypothetical protein
MKEFLKAMIGKSIEEVMAMAKEKGFEFECHEQTEDELASIDFEVSGYEVYLCFDEKGLADEWGYYSAE